MASPKNHVPNHQPIMIVVAQSVYDHGLIIDASLIEGSLEAKLPTIWTVETQSREESEEKRSEERRGRCAKR